MEEDQLRRFPVLSILSVPSVCPVFFVFFVSLC
jgi:hypothetical protein